MRKSGVFLFAVAMFVWGSCFFDHSIQAKAEERDIVYVGGMSAGFTLKTEGVQVIGLCEVMTDGRVKSPALEAGLRVGDVIVKVEGILIDSMTQMNELINEADGKTLRFHILRGEEELIKEIKPVQDKVSERYKIGVLVRDSVSGIGTITYIEKNGGRFGALGHAVSGDNHRPMRIEGGSVYTCSIVNIVKGVRGKAGELKGMFLNDSPFGCADKLCDCGIFGNVSEKIDTEQLQTAVANSAQVKPGNAYIYSTTNGICPQKYEIEIVKVDKQNRENKNYVIRIKDEDLLAETGGIVQGMSGSPILQNGKLVGAVTHVFLNDPTRGYGIDIQKMLNK